MAFLIANGVTVPVAPQNAKVTTTEIGDRSRAFDGTMRGSIIARKRTWTLQTTPMLPADAATVRAALIASPTITISGDWPGSTVTVWPKLGDDTPVQVGGGHRIVLAVTLDEA
jgi:hypothetical protein